MYVCCYLQYLKFSMSCPTQKNWVTLQWRYFRCQCLPGCLLQNPKVHYFIHKSIPLVHIISHMIPVPTFQPSLPKINSNITSHLCLGLASGLFPSDSPEKILYAFLISPMYATCPAHLSFLDLITLIILGELYMLQSSSLCSLLQPPTTSSLLNTKSCPCA